MKKVLFLSLIIYSIQGFSQMQEVLSGPKNKVRHMDDSIQEEETPVVDLTQENNKKFYKGLYNKVQKSHPSWTKEEVLKYIEPLWYKKQEIDKANINRKRPSLSNESDVKTHKERKLTSD